jgi:hypothetical protein
MINVFLRWVLEVCVLTVNLVLDIVMVTVSMMATSKGSGLNKIQWSLFKALSDFGQHLYNYI